jgi:hypothetical protein
MSRAYEAPVEPRPHPTAFAKRLLPNLAFSSFDKVFAELTGPKREAFLMYLWNQAGEGLAEHVRPADPGRMPGTGTMGVVKLEVVGAIERQGVQVAIVSMPPAIAPNEAIFVALVRAQGRVTVFFLERCRDQAGVLSEHDVVLAGVTPEQRTSYGFFQGDGLATLKNELGRLVGVSLDGIERSLPPITMAAFVGAPGALGAPPGLGHVASPGRPATPAWASAHSAAGILVILLGVRVGVPLALRFLPLRIPGLQPLVMVLSLAVSIATLVWLYRVFDAYRDKTKYSPGFAVGSWFIPFANMVMPPLVVRDAMRAVTGEGASGLVFGWWIAYLLHTVYTAVGPSLFMGQGFDLATLQALSWVGTILAFASYGLLWAIVKKIDG